MAHKMSSAGHARALLTLGLPLIGGHLAQFAIGATDALMLGWYGVEELAAGVLGSAYFFVFFVMGSGFAWAVMPMVATESTRNGADADRQVRRITRMGLWLSLIFAVLCLPITLWSEPILRAMGQEPVVAELAADYLRIAGWGLIPALAVMILKSYLAALERTQVVLWVTVIAAILNGLINWVLIFGNLGAPELGIRGAAIASVSIQIVSLVVLVVYARRVFPEHQLFVRFWRPDWQAFGQVLRLGWPIGLTNLAEVGLFAASAVLMGWVGTLPLAAHGIALNLASATFMVHMGLSNAATVRAGKAMGARDMEGLARGARVTVVLSLAFAAVTIAVFLTMPEPLLGLFLSPDEPQRDAIIALGVILMVYAALFQTVDGAQVVALGLLRGVQDTRVPMIIASVSYWGIGIPFSYISAFHWGWGPQGIWAGLVVGLLCAAVALMYRFFWVSLPAVSADPELQEATRLV